MSSVMLHVKFGVTRLEVMAVKPPVAAAAPPVTLSGLGGFGREDVVSWDFCVHPWTCGKKLWRSRQLLLLLLL
jgi:hypothetical protein